jgi:large subunit ribosomal protein L10
MDQFLPGPTAFAFSKEDPLASAKILTDFSREYPALNIKGGVFEKGTLDPEQVNLWATLPGREELLAKVAAGFKSPLSNLVFSLKGIITNFIYALEAIKEKKEQ